MSLSHATSYQQCAFPPNHAHGIQIPATQPTSPVPTPVTSVRSWRFPVAPAFWHKPQFQTDLGSTAPRSVPGFHWGSHLGQTTSSTLLWLGAPLPRPWDQLIGLPLPHPPLFYQGLGETQRREVSASLLIVENRTKHLFLSLSSQPLLRICPPFLWLDKHDVRQYMRPCRAPTCEERQHRCWGMSPSLSPFTCSVIDVLEVYLSSFSLFSWVPAVHHFPCSECLSPKILKNFISPPTEQPTLDITQSLAYHPGLRIFFRCPVSFWKGNLPRIPCQHPPAMPFSIPHTPFRGSLICLGIGPSWMSRT